jgi:hypothetical protein
MGQRLGSVPWDSSKTGGRLWSWRAALGMVTEGQRINAEEKVGPARAVGMSGRRFQGQGRQEAARNPLQARGQKERGT